jgi:hypothetical protein
MRQLKRLMVVGSAYLQVIFPNYFCWGHALIGGMKKLEGWVVRNFG